MSGRSRGVPKAKSSGQNVTGFTLGSAISSRIHRYSPLAVPSTPHRTPERHALTSRRSGLCAVNCGQERMSSDVGRCMGPVYCVAQAPRPYHAARLAEARGSLTALMLSDPQNSQRGRSCCHQRVASLACLLAVSSLCGMDHAGVSSHLKAASMRSLDVASWSVRDTLRFGTRGGSLFSKHLAGSGIRGEQAESVTDRRHGRQSVQNSLSPTEATWKVVVEPRS